jgi:hypothetical protein
MARARKLDEEEAQARLADTGSAGEGAGESQIREVEVYRMAAFRIRETANRIATLANSARDDGLRRELQRVHERLLSEERGLLARTDR